MKRRPSIWITAFLFFLLNAYACIALADTSIVQAISPSQFKSLLDRHQGDIDVMVLDVRTAKEYDAGHIREAVLLDYYSRDFVDRLKALDREKTYLIYCRSGNRSGKSLVIFEKLGFNHAYHMVTGINGWSRENYPLVR